MGKVVVLDPAAFRQGWEWAARHPERVAREFRGYVQNAEGGPRSLRDFSAGVVAWWDAQLASYQSFERIL